MRTTRRMIAAAICAVLMVLGAGPAGANPVNDAAPAILSTAQDMAASEAAYAAYLASAPQVTCDTRLRNATGTPQINFPSGAIFANDAAHWSVECISLDSPPPSYTLRMRIRFEYYEAGWQPVEGSDGTCLQPSNLGVAARPDCLVTYQYGHNDPRLNKYHRARFDLLQPYQLPPFYSPPWLAGGPVAIATD